MKNKISILAILLLFINYSFAQKKEHLHNINQQVWQVFTKAFETNNADLFASIHSPDMIRITGDGKSIKTFNEYIEGYKKRWAGNTRNQTISFRFLERISNPMLASERGIYKLTINPNTPEEKSYYGKFHVVLKNEVNQWKILMDYDSSENNSINEHSYKSAFAIDDYKSY